MEQATADKLVRKKDLKIISPDDKITSAVSQLISTHDAVFVCSDDRFQGIVNLYHSFLGKRWSQNQKVKTCLYQPPILKKGTPIKEIARLMVESRVYRLPVLSKEKLLGVVYAEDVMTQAAQLDLFRQPIKEGLSIRKPIFVDRKTTITKAIHQMLKNNTNRLLVGNQANLEGILTLYDLRSIYSQPRDRVAGVFSRTPIKKEFGNKKVEKFFKPNVVVIKSNQSLADGVKLMLSENIGSLVVTCSEGVKTLGMVTWRDFLKLIATLDEEGVEVTFSQLFTKKSLKLAKESTVDKIQMLVNQNPLFAKKVKRIDLKLEEVAKSKDDVRLPLLEVTAMVRLKKGNQLLRSEAKGRTVKYMVDEVFDNIKRLLRKKND